MNIGQQRVRETGFTLIELMIVSVIMVFTIGIIATILANIQKTSSQQQARTEAVNDATAALDMITRLIRAAGNNPAAIDPLVPIDPEAPVGGFYKTIHIQADWCGYITSAPPDGDIEDPYEDVRFFVQNNILMKQEASDTDPVEFLDNVIDMQFIYYDTNNTMIADPVANIKSVARVDVSIIMQSPRTAPLTFKSSAFMRSR